MVTGYCRNCRRDIHDDHHYFGYCGPGCCAEYACDMAISFYEAKNIGFGERERNILEDKVSELECEVSNKESQIDSMYGDIGSLEDSCNSYEETIKNLKDVVDKLKNLDWNNIKRERKCEAEYNESVIRKMNNIKREDTDIKEQSEKVKRDNILLKDQNLELLIIIKDMRKENKRFELIDLGIELDYEDE